MADKANTRKLNNTTVDPVGNHAGDTPPFYLSCDLLGTCLGSFQK